MLGVVVPAALSLAEAFCPSCRPVSLRPTPLAPKHSSVVPRWDEWSFVRGCPRRSLNRITTSSAPFALLPHKSNQALSLIPSSPLLSAVWRRGWVENAAEGGRAGQAHLGAARRLSTARPPPPPTLTCQPGSQRRSGVRAAYVGRWRVPGVACLAAGRGRYSSEGQGTGPGR